MDLFVGQSNRDAADFGAVLKNNGVFGFSNESSAIGLDDLDLWCPLEDAKPDRFVIQVVGDSMTPEIPDRSLCLFRSGDALAGTREGKIVLVRSTGLTDPDTGSRFTVKQYRSEKVAVADGSWQHTRIILEPLNQAHAPIELTAENREDFAVLGEFERVVRLT